MRELFEWNSYGLKKVRYRGDIEAYLAEQRGVKGDRIRFSNANETRPIG